jgi:hypothetical protein
VLTPPYLQKKHLLKILGDIRFWIVFFFILRLVGITNAPLEIGHNWRQALTNMITRNFLEDNSNILFPKIDMRGNGSGIIGSEFPLFNYISYLISAIFGYTHWYGRLVNLVVSSIGIFYFYKLVEKICNKQTAFNASLILICSIWFAFSRKIMPDTFSVALVIIGLYAGYSYLISGKIFDMLLFFVFITSGMLCKIPALSLVSVVAVVLLVKEISIKRKIYILTVTFFSVSIVGVWYFYWVPYLVKTYQYALYFPKGLFEGLKEILPFWREFLEKFVFSSLSSYVAFLAFILGFFYLLISNQRHLKAGLLFISITFFIFILKTGAVFPLHNYYIIPFTPIMAIIAGYGLSKLSTKYQTLIILLIAVEGIANQHHDFFIHANEKYKLSLEGLIDTKIEKNKLIVINGGPSPQEIYFSHRKGWTIGNELINKISLANYKETGASYLIINRKSFSAPIDYLPKIYSDNNYDFYQLK